MRAVVIAVKDNKAAVAIEGGELKYVENKNYVTGQIIQVQDVSPKTVSAKRKHRKRSFYLRSYTRFSGIAAAAVLFVFVGAITVSAAEVSRVTLTAGASVTYGVNIFDRVISVSANNEEGRLIIDEISGDVMFRKLPDAFETILDSIKDGEYIDDENPVIRAEVTTDAAIFGNREKTILSELGSAADEWSSKQSGISVSVDKGGTEFSGSSGKNTYEDEPAAATDEADDEPAQETAPEIRHDSEQTDESMAPPEQGKKALNPGDEAPAEKSIPPEPPADRDAENGELKPPTDIEKDTAPVPGEGSGAKESDESVQDHGGNVPADAPEPPPGGENTPPAPSGSGEGITPGPSEERPEEPPQMPPPQKKGPEGAPPH